MNKTVVAPRMKPTPQRILCIDAAKGIAILLMVGVHALYVLTHLGLVDRALVESLWYILVSRMIALSFVALSTIVLWYQAQQIIKVKIWYIRVVRQVAKLSLAALVISLATRLWLDQSYVRFGILHLLATATAINGLLFQQKFPRWWLISMGTVVIITGVFLQFFSFPFTGWEWIGFISNDFASADYVPVLPWLGITWLAAAAAPNVLSLAKVLQARIEHEQNLSWILWCGRHSLLIYLIHVPLLMGIISLLSHLR